MTIYGLILTLCLIDNSCYETVPAVFETEEECIVEVMNQRAKGIPQEMLHCEILED